MASASRAAVAAASMPDSRRVRSARSLRSRTRRRGMLWPRAYGLFLFLFLLLLPSLGVLFLGAFLVVGRLVLGFDLVSFRFASVEIEDVFEDELWFALFGD